MTPVETVIDPGPIPYARIDLYGDPDLEHALREEGLDPQATTYRLIEIPLSSVTDTASMPWPRMGTAYVDAHRSGQEFPPIVVLRTRRGSSTLLDCARSADEGGLLVLFGGDDWAEDHHDVKVVDDAGQRLAKARVPVALMGSRAYMR